MSQVRLELLQHLLFLCLCHEPVICQCLFGLSEHLLILPLHLQTVLALQQMLSHSIVIDQLELTFLNLRLDSTTRPLHDLLSLFSLQRRISLGESGDFACQSRCLGVT